MHSEWINDITANKLTYWDPKNLPQQSYSHHNIHGWHLVQYNILMYNTVLFICCRVKRNIAQMFVIRVLLFYIIIIIIWNTFNTVKVYKNRPYNGRTILVQGVTFLWCFSIINTRTMSGSAFNWTKQGKQ
jgi:hypothetical protein